MGDKIDAEIRAMKKIATELDKLDERGRLRALAYMLDKYVGPEMARPVWDAAASAGTVTP